jgi:cell division protein YceG involved in septum cleavage
MGQGGDAGQGGGGCGTERSWVNYHGRLFFPAVLTRLLRRLLLLLLVAAAVAAGALGWWVTQPLALSGDTVEVRVPAGASLRTAARQAARAGVRAPACCSTPISAGRWAAADHQAGNYEVTRGTTAGDLLDKLVRGDRIMLPVTLVEGWTSARCAGAGQGAPAHDTAAMSDGRDHGRSGPPRRGARGRFFPDTYTPRAGELAVLRAPCSAMDSAWPGLGRARRPAAQVARRGADPGQHRRKGNRPAADRPRLPACSSTACASACRCRPTPR